MLLHVELFLESLFILYPFQVQAKINQMNALYEAELVRQNERKRSLEGKWLFFLLCFKNPVNFETEDELLIYLKIFK